MARVIYEPPESSKQCHRCTLPGAETVRCGSVALCDTCGTGWVVVEGDYSQEWRPIWPWPFDRKARKAIREARP